MAIRDRENLYSDAQALTVTAPSTDIIDHGADRDIGIGEPMVVVLTLDVAADDADANETYVAALETDDNEGFASPTQVGGTATIPRGSVAGSVFYIPVPPDTTFERFSRINFTLGGTTPSVTVTAALVPQSFVQNDQNYPDGFTIS